MAWSRRALFALTATLFGAACGPTVIVPGDDGDLPQVVVPSPVDPQDPPPDPDPDPDPTCETTCSNEPGTLCSCVESCSSSRKIECYPPDPEGKTLCVCIIPDLMFSGACYEKKSENICDFDQGCCIKYFTGK